MAIKRLWVARDSRKVHDYSRLWLYSRKPRKHKKDGCFYAPNGFTFPLPEKALPGVTWENSPVELYPLGMRSLVVSIQDVYKKC